MKTAGRSVRLTRKPDLLQGTFVAMGSPCEVLLQSNDESLAKKLVDIVANEAWRIEDKFSRYLPGNIIDRINHSNGHAIEVDAETANLLDFAATLTELSEGRFDVTSGVLREAWTFDGSDNVPADDVVDAVRQRVGWHKIDWSRPSLTLRPSMQVDLGGIGKEYAVDKAASLLHELADTPVLVNFGGDILATGAAVGSNAWQVGIDAPHESDALSRTIIRLQNGGLATSGDARRFLLKDGVRYGHILNPATGWPAENAARSITVAADTCTQAGMLATLAMLKGAQAERFLEQQGVQFWCYR